MKLEQTPHCCRRTRRQTVVGRHAQEREIHSELHTRLGCGDGVIRGLARDGRVGAVARADVARVASTVLRDPGAHHNETYDLTGREALTQ
jgi:uncharacterized protein YbjT (DUF2867 family)